MQLYPHPIIDNSSQGFWLLKIQRGNVKIVTEWTVSAQVTELIEKVREFSKISGGKNALSDEERADWLTEFNSRQQMPQESSEEALKDNTAVADKMDFIAATMSNPLLSLSHHTNDVSDLQRKNMMKIVKDEFVMRGLKARESEFVSYQSRNILLGTWNVNGKLVSESLLPWLQSSINDPAAPPSIIALGFQELDLSAEPFITN